MPTEHVRAEGHSRSRSLGRLAVSWMEHFCLHGPGDVQGDAVRLSDELAGLTADCYALDESGWRLYDSVFFSRPKGCDKSGHAARIAMLEALGPCRFAGWSSGGETYTWLDFRYVYARGEPMGQPVTYPFIRCLATEEGQTGNTYDAIFFNLREGPLREAFARADDVGLTRVYLPGGGEIRPSTASSAAKDGGKETWANFDETHLYSMPELRRMYATVRRNMAKRRDAEAWSFETSTMYEPGKESVAEASHEMARKIREGKTRRTRMLFDHREAPADVDLSDEAAVRAALAEAYGDAASYIPIERIISELWDLRNDVSDTRRYFFNQATAAFDAWVAPHEWDRLANPAQRVAEGALVTLGFDGSKTDDHTALIACEVETGFIWPLGIWDPGDYDGEAPRGEIDGAVRRAFVRFDVVGFYSDLAPWESYVDAWALDLGRPARRDGLCVSASPRNPIAWDMRGRKLETVKMIEGFHDAVVERVLSHDGDPALARHIHNARRRSNQYGVAIGKEAPKSARKIDAAVAACLAWQSRRDYLALPDHRKRRRRSGRAMFA
jgi:hypothetical protein